MESSGAVFEAPAFVAGLDDVAVNTDFTYNGVAYTAGTDEEQIALGDNFLSMIIPEIEASQAFKNNGEIVIWNDETEGDEDVGSTNGFDGTEIIISPLAKGNAYTNNILYTTPPIWSRCRTSSGSPAAARAAISGPRATLTRSPICSSRAQSRLPFLSRRLG